MGITIQLAGGDVLSEQLASLGRKVSGQIARDALRAAVKPIQAAMIAKVPVLTGLLRRSIKVRARSDGHGRYAMLVSSNTSRAAWNRAGKRSVAGKGSYDVYYGAFVEYGHFQGKRHGGRKTRGAANGRNRVPANPFVGPAFDENYEETARLIEQGVLTGIEVSL